MLNIKKYRGLAGISQQELGDRVGLTRQSICMIESSECNHITFENAKKISEVLNCSVFDLYGLDNLRYLPENDEQVSKLIKLIFTLFKDENNKKELINTLQKELEKNGMD